jgi:GMP synthase-like glutamine amidotransferase
MKIGILKADSVLEQFQPEHGDYPDMFVRRLGDNAPESVEFTTYDVEHGVYPNHMDDCDGYVITGSKKSVYDDEDWIRVLEAYVVELHEHLKPLIGICFGHQLVAQALGGKTEAAAVGWGVGVHESTIHSQLPYMEPALAQARVLVSHKDQVTQLPPGASLLASSEFCPNSMFQIGEHIFCMQGHPEFRAGYSKDLMNMRRELLGEAVYAAGIDSLQQDLHSDTIARWIVQFITAANTAYAAAGA